MTKQQLERVREMMERYLDRTFTKATCDELEIAIAIIDEELKQMA